MHRHLPFSVPSQRRHRPGQQLSKEIWGHGRNYGPNESE
jgi:hypothetical protein